MPGIEWVEDEPPAVRATPGIADSVGGESRAVLRSWSRRQVVVAGICVAALAGGISAYLLTRPPQPLTVTWNGAKVVNASSAIDGADARFRDFVATHHGAIEKDSRCYLTRRSAGGGTDITTTAKCGPVLFYDSYPASAEYLSYQVDAADPDRNGFQLTVADAPESQVPLPFSLDLAVRPDRRRPPAHSALKVPVPPAVSPGSVNSVSVSDIPSTPFLPPSDVIGSKNVSVALLSTGYIPRYTVGDDARSAPAGQRLLAFVIGVESGELGSPVDDTALDLGLSVDGGRVAPLPGMHPIGSDVHAFVASVPATADSVELVLHDAGYTQRMSVIDGKPGPDNIRILRLLNQPDQTIAGGTGIDPGTLTATFHGRPVDTTTGQPLLSLEFSGLVFFTPYGQVPGSAADAFLVSVPCVQSDAFADPLRCFPLHGMTITLTIPGHAPLRARDIGDGPNPYYVIEVPAGFARGTLTVTGSGINPDGYAVTMQTPYVYQFTPS